MLQTILYELAGGWSRAKALDNQVPTHLVMPTGTRVLVDYSREQPTVSVRIQVWTWAVWTNSVDVWTQNEVR